jgi:hypothetical protein
MDQQQHKLEKRNEPDQSRSYPHTPFDSAGGENGIPLNREKAPRNALPAVDAALLLTNFGLPRISDTIAWLHFGAANPHALWAQQPTGGSR